MRTKWILTMVLVFVAVAVVNLFPMISNRCKRPRLRLVDIRRAGVGDQNLSVRQQSCAVK